MSIRELKILPLVSFALFLLAVQALAEDATKWVYKIRIAVTAYSSEPIIQTGFRLKGTKGIFTTLHGVINGKELSAANDLNELFTNLRIVKVDLNKDLALLISDEISTQPPEGLELGNIDTVVAGQSLHVLGNPLGMALYDKRVVAGKPVFKTLSKMIPPGSAEAFHKRKSPYEDIDVLNIDGTLAPGHSGAPLLDSRDRVLGVVDGGIIGAEICWAIPVARISWKNVGDEQERLDELSHVDPRELFSFSIEERTQNWQINFACLSPSKDLRELGFHLGVDHPVVILGANCEYGLELGYLIRHFTTTYSTLPGFDNAKREERKVLIFASLYGGIVPFAWDWFNPSLGILVGYPLNLQALLRIRLVKLHRVTLNAEWRTMFYNSEILAVTFNRYGNASQIAHDENTVQMCLGISLSLGFDLPWEDRK